MSAHNFVPSNLATHMVRFGLLAACMAVALQAQTIASRDPNAAAKVISLTGDVSVMKDAQPWALQVGQAIQMKQVVVTGQDGYAVFQISDGSTFEVYPNSTVTFRNNPADWRDLLDVWLGRVKVKIQHLNGQPNPNRIQTPTAVISVRGTVFDVSVEDEDETTLVSVEEGQVAVQHARLPFTNPKLVNAGEYLRVYRSQPLAESDSAKAVILRKILDMITDAANTAVNRRGGLGRLPGIGGGTGPVGDTGGGTGPGKPGGSTPGTSAPPSTPPSLPPSPHP